MSWNSQNQILESIRIQCDIQPGDNGGVIVLDGIVYPSEYNYNHAHEESYVAGTFVDFTESYNLRNDRL